MTTSGSTYLRYRLDLAFEEPVSKQDLKIIKDMEKLVKDAKKKAKKINQGKPNEENTIYATYHVCRHEQGLPCDPEIDI